MNHRGTLILVAFAIAVLPLSALAQGWSQALPTNTTRGINGLFSVSSTMTIAVGNNGTIIGTTDGGNTWNSGNSGTTEHLRKVFVSGFTLPTITVVGDNGTILRSTDAGLSWTPLTSGVSLDLLDIFVHDPTNGTTMTAVGESGVILWTNNGGNNWMLRLSPVPATMRGVFFKTLLEGFTVGDNGTILHTTNNGNNWAAVASGTSANLHHVYFTDADTGWVVGDSGVILKSTDAGATWSTQTSPTTAHLRRLMFTSTSTGSIVGDNGVILRTTDAGWSWQQQSSGTTRDLSSVFFVDASNGMATGEQGLVIATTNGGVPVELRGFSAQTQANGAVRLQWETESETQNFGFDVQREAGTGWETLGFVDGHGDSEVSRSYVYTDRTPPAVPTLRYRLRQIDFDGGWEYLPEARVERTGIPATASLAAWPNPFTSVTNLQVTLPVSTPVRVRVYDVAGRLLATLHEGALHTGTHVLPWRASALGSGRYHATLEFRDDVTNAYVRQVLELILQK
jgi:photosystem II stability/assembly factor-like uncharacterized protein